MVGRNALDVVVEVRVLVSEPNSPVSSPTLRRGAGAGVFLSSHSMAIRLTNLT